MRYSIIVVAVLFIPAFVYSDTIIVPDDYPTIQGAIDASVNGDTVLVKPGTYVENIDFKGKGITVQSEQGAEVTVIDGGNPVDPDYGSVVYINNGEPITAILDGFTITNGTGTLWSPGYYDGGGIYCWGSSATIINNIIEGNIATDTGGGILCWEFVDVICTNNIIKGNQGGLGGGIGCGTFTTAGTITISENTIEKNTAPHPSGGGGGIYCLRISPFLCNNIISSNSGTIGGGMYNDSSSPTLTGCIFIGNSSSGNGGGLCSYDIPLGTSSSTLTNCIFLENSAILKGGAIYFFNGLRSTVIHCTFNQNMANDSGGAISCSYSPMALTNTILWDNNAPSEPEIHDIGGSIIATFSDIKAGWPGTGNIDADPLFMTGPEGDYYLSQVAAGQLMDSPCVDAGACHTAVLGMDTCWTRTDEVPDDGFADMGFHYGPFSSPSPPMTIHVPADSLSIQMAIYVSNSGSSILVAPGTYTENLDFLGRIISVRSDEDGDETTHDTSPETTIIDGNQSGCVITFINGETADTVLEGFTIRNGHNEYWGGGINCFNNSSPVISNNIIAGNMAEHGGGMYNSYGSPTVTHCTFKNNTASKGGGGIYNAGNITVTHCMFHVNTAIHGGGMYNSGNPTVSSCLFIENSAVNNGGGMFDNGGYSWSPIVTNCVFSHNLADGSGGGMFSSGSYSWSPIVTNCTFSQNMASIEGGGISNYDSHPTLTNCILWNDTPDEIYNDSTSYPTVTYSCVHGGYPGIGNIDSDPLFVDAANDDFHISFLSPCRGSGDNSAVTELYDFEGDPRIYQGTVDMGADEFYTHLYVTGDKTPGGAIQGKFVGLPGTTPVGLFIGSDVLPSPMNTMWGEYWLQAPWLMFGPLGAIPSTGVMVLPTTLPSGMTVPVDIPMQALIGLNPDSLTNLCVLEVR